MTALFRRARAGVTVTAKGAGTGHVRSDPAGIDCGADCSYPFPTGTTVTLRADADAGARFVVWSNGPCTDSGSCTITPTRDSTATAEFVRCAADAFTAFSVAARRHARRVVVGIPLSDGATVRARVLRSGSTLAKATRMLPAAGSQSIVIPIARRTKSGAALVAVAVVDLCGGTRTLHRTVAIPRQ